MPAAFAVLVVHAAQAAPEKAAEKPRPAQSAAKKPATAKKRAAPPPPEAVEPAPPAAADAEQLVAAARVYYGVYDCEFNQSIDIAESSKFPAYVEVKHGKAKYLMKPVVSTTGAVRLEDVRGETLMVQIASKSMLLNVKSAQRLVDDCVSPKQRELIEADGSRRLAAAAPPGRRGRRRFGRQSDRSPGTPVAGSRPSLTPRSAGRPRRRARPDNAAHVAPFQFQRRPRGAARGGAAPGGRRDARLARQRHVGDGDEPSRQGVHRDRRRGRGRPARAARDSRQLQGAVPAGRRDRPERDRADEPAARPKTSADYVDTGEWSKKSIERGEAVLHASTSRPSARGRQLHVVPTQADVEARPDAAYVHIAPNETIGGVEYHWTPDTGDVPLVADMSSQHPVAADRRRAVRRDLRRRAEEHRAGRPHDRHRARRPARPGAADHASALRLHACRPTTTRCSTRRRPSRSTSPDWCSSG